MPHTFIHRLRMVGPATLAVLFGLGGCSTVSEETKRASVDVLCSQIDARSADVRASAETARLVALIVRDLAPDVKVREIADHVARNPGELSVRAQLADWVSTSCAR